MSLNLPVTLGRDIYLNVVLLTHLSKLLRSHYRTHGSLDVALALMSGIEAGLQQCFSK